MLLPRSIACLFWIGLILIGAAGAYGQGYPFKPVRIVTQAVGGGTDFVARSLAQGIAAPLGQPVIVDNRGGNSTVAALVVAKAAADGYTLLEVANSFWLAPDLRSKVPYDPVKDFSPITFVARSPQILVVHPSVTAKSVRELISLAKARPGELNYAAASSGGSPHLAAELFKAMAGVNIVRIAYQGSGASTTDLIAGQVQMTFGPAASVMPFVGSGKLRALAVTTAEPSAIAPELPTIAASGVPGYESETMYGAFVPAKTPAAAIGRLNLESVRFLKTAKAKEQFLKYGVETVGSAPLEFAAMMKSDMSRMRKLIQDTGIREE